MDSIDASETSISDTRDFARVFGDYEFYASFSGPGMGSEMAVLFKKSLDLKIRTIFQDQEGKLVVLDTSDSEDIAFIPVAVYVPTGARLTDFFRRLEVFIGTSHFLRE